MGMAQLKKCAFKPYIHVFTHDVRRNSFCASLYSHQYSLQNKEKQKKDVNPIEATVTHQKLDQKVGSWIRTRKVLSCS